MKNLRRLVILGAAALSLTGCAWHNTGPCFGVGCPSWASATAPAAKTTAEVPATPAANQTASATTAEPSTAQTAPAAKSSKGGFFARVKSVFTPHSKATASNSASASASAGSSSGR